MAQSTLGAQKREGTGKGVARRLREDGRIPAVLYGRDLDALHLSVSAHEAERLFRSISTENTIVSLDVEGDKAPYETLVREIQTHPAKGSLLHIDFLRIQAGVAVDVEVPVELVGTPMGVKHQGGVLEQIVHELPVRCIPSKIPQTVEVDVSHLEVGDSIHVYDINLGEGVEVTIEQDQTICTVAVPRILEETVTDEDAEAAALAEGEVPEGEEGADDDGDEGDGDDA